MKQILRSAIHLFIIFVLATQLHYETAEAQGPPPPPPPPDLSGTILNTKHNLSVSGPGTVKSTTEDRVCIFCHTPHNADTNVPYLWNRSDPADNYIPYQSTTLYSTVGQPTGASKMCLSCHDGTIALGALLTEQFEIPFSGGIRFMPEGDTKLGTDLSDDHPISLVYNNTLASNNSEIKFL